MIVLDEQLLGRNLEIEIARWYPGPVCFITDLRPGSVIKDDAIPQLLQTVIQPTFVTINERDFWRKTVATDYFCIVCFSLSDARATEIAKRLRSLLRERLFSTKKLRMGTVIRVTDGEVSYYTAQDRTIHTLNISI